MFSCCFQHHTIEQNIQINENIRKIMVKFINSSGLAPCDLILFSNLTCFAVFRISYQMLWCWWICIYQYSEFFSEKYYLPISKFWNLEIRYSSCYTQLLINQLLIKDDLPLCTFNNSKNSFEFLYFLKPQYSCVIHWLYTLLNHISTMF